MPNAVSYTHLDVYKRQVLEGITSAYDGMRRRRNAFAHGLGGSFDNNRG